MRSLFVIALVCAAPAMAAAQPGHIEIEPPATSERVFLLFDVGMSAVLGERFSSAHARPNPFLPSTNNFFKVDYDLGRALGGNIGFGLMATPRLGFGASRTRVKYHDMLATTTVRRPLLFRSGSVIYANGYLDRSDSTSAHRVEQAYHLEVSGVLVRTRLFLLRAFAGPTWFDISQGLVRVLDDADAHVREQSSVDAAAWGYHGGLDVATYFSNETNSAGIGVGTSIRYSRATIASINALDPASGPQQYSAGGWYVSAGLRGRF